MSSEHLVAAMAAAWISMRLVTEFVSPIWDRLKWDRFFIKFLAMPLGFASGWFTGVNIFPMFVESPLFGRILTCVGVALGPNFLYDLFDRAPTPPPEK